MNTTTVIILAIVLLLIAVAAFFYFRQRRSENLRKQFGPEYKRAVKQYGDQRKAEAELAEREKRVRKLDIRGLTRDEKNRFADNWKKTQARFVDAPSPAVSEADSLVKELMLARRYPVGEFQQRAADISVDHPAVGEQLPRCARNCGAQQEWESNHGRFAAGNGALPLAL
jgi:hypothetical protein